MPRFSAALSFLLGASLATSSSAATVDTDYVYASSVAEVNAETYTNSYDFGPNYKAVYLDAGKYTASEGEFSNYFMIGVQKKDIPIALEDGVDVVPGVNDITYTLACDRTDWPEGCTLDGAGIVGHLSISTGHDFKAELTGGYKVSGFKFINGYNAVTTGSTDIGRTKVVFENCAWYSNRTPNGVAPAVQISLYETSSKNTQNYAFFNGVQFDDNQRINYYAEECDKAPGSEWCSSDQLIKYNRDVHIVIPDSENIADGDWPIIEFSGCPVGSTPNGDDDGKGAFIRLNTDDMTQYVTDGFSPISSDSLYSYNCTYGSVAPTPSPAPTMKPTMWPTLNPTAAPTTLAPTVQSAAPTAAPTGSTPAPTPAALVIPDSDAVWESYCTGPIGTACIDGAKMAGCDSTGNCWDNTFSTECAEAIVSAMTNKDDATLLLSSACYECPTADELKSEECYNKGCFFALLMVDDVCAAEEVYAVTLPMGMNIAFNGGLEVGEFPSDPALLNILKESLETTIEYIIGYPGIEVNVHTIDGKQISDRRLGELDGNNILFDVNMYMAWEPQYEGDTNMPTYMLPAGDFQMKLTDSTDSGSCTKCFKNSLDAALSEADPAKAATLKESLGEFYVQQFRMSNDQVVGDKETNPVAPDESINGGGGGGGGGDNDDGEEALDGAGSKAAAATGAFAAAAIAAIMI
jgi:hypothetical protein